MRLDVYHYDSAVFFQEGSTAFHMAIIRGHTETLRVLLKRGADPNTLKYVSDLNNT